MPRTSSAVTSVLVDRVHDPAVVHDADPVGQVEDVVDVVADEEDADALGLELPDEVAHLGGLGRAERGRGLVHDQDPGVEVDRAGDGDGLALAAGQRLHRLREAREVGVEPAHDLARLGLHASSRRACPSRVVSSRPRNMLPGASMLSARASVW